MIDEENPSVETAATLFKVILSPERGNLSQVLCSKAYLKEYCYEYRDHFSAGILVAGWDPIKGGQVNQAYSSTEFLKNAV